MKHIYLIFFLMLGLIMTSHGVMAQSAVKSLKTNQASEITIYPNPAEDYFSIMAKDVNITTLTIHNIVGKEVKTLTAKAGNKYEIQDLRRGIYIVRVYDENDNMIKALRLSKT